MLRQHPLPLDSSGTTASITVRQRLLYGARAGCFVALVVLTVWISDLFAETRLRMANVLYVPRATSGEVVIIAVDNASLSEYGRALVMWPRSLHADLIDRVSRAGARVIAFDVLFAETAEGDETFAAAIERARIDSPAHTRVVMPVVGVQHSPADPIGHYAHILGPNDTLQAAPIVLGHANVVPDQDGTVRRQPVEISSTNGGDYLSFAITTYLTYLRISPGVFDSVVSRDGHTLRLTPLRAVPVDDQGSMMINYFGASESDAFPVFSYRAVLAGEVDPASLDGKIVLVGLMNNTGLGEMYAVPISFNQTMMSGVEIHANLIETLIQNKPLRQQPRWLQALVIVLLAVGAGMLFQIAAGHWMWYAAAVLASLGSGLIGAFLIFNLTRIIPDLFDILLVFAFAAVAVLIQHNMLEVRQRRRTEMLWQSMIVASQQKLNLTHILPVVAQDLQRILPSSRIEIWLWNSRVRQLERTYVDPAIPDSPIRSERPTSNVPAEANAVAKDPPVLDTATLDPMVAQALGSGLICQEAERIAVPLIWQGQPRGVFLCTPRQRVRARTHELLTLFAWQTAATLANATLYAEAQNLSELKTRMLRMASHDLKNPLSVIFMHVRTLKKSVDNPNFNSTVQRDFLNRIDNASRIMLDIINEILDLEQARRGQLVTDSCHLPVLLREALEHHEADFQEHHHTVLTDIPSDFPATQGDPVQLREALSNLLGNAAKYTPDGGQIRVSLALCDSTIRIAVQDNGYGIAPEAQTRLFQEFYRVQTDQTAHIPGTGLGLSLVKAIVEAHEGRVGVESVEGKGSTFTIELPLVTPPDPHERAV